MHFLIALTIIASLGYSQCTGGLAGIPYALAAEIGENFGHDDVAMSLAPIECSRTENMSTDQNETKQTSGCRDGESCIEQLTQSSIKQIATEETRVNILEEILPSSIAVNAFDINGEPPRQTMRRKGPLFEGALLAAHITIKRE